MTHTQQRLQERNIKDISDSQLWTIARQYNESVAIIIAKLDSHMGTNEGNFTTRKESNGDLVVLIVRDSRPITIMYRRSSQTNTPSQLRVNRIVDNTTH